MAGARKDHMHSSYVILQHAANGGCWPNKNPNQLFPWLGPVYANGIQIKRILHYTRYIIINTFDVWVCIQDADFQD